MQVRVMKRMWTNSASPARGWSRKWLRKHLTRNTNYSATPVVGMGEEMRRRLALIQDPKMGWVQGQGLGKNGTGMTDFLPANLRYRDVRGKKGLGYSPPQQHSWYGHGQGSHETAQASSVGSMIDMKLLEVGARKFSDKPKVEQLLSRWRWTFIDQLKLTFPSLVLAVLARDRRRPKSPVLVQVFLACIKVDDFALSSLLDKPLHGGGDPATVFQVL